MLFVVTFKNKTGGIVGESAYDLTRGEIVGKLFDFAQSVRDDFDISQCKEVSIIIKPQEGKDAVQ